MDKNKCPFFIFHPTNFSKKMRFSDLNHIALNQKKMIINVTATLKNYIFKN